MNCGCGCKDCTHVQPGGCLLAGIIVGMLLLILLSSCGAINVPKSQYQRTERIIDTRRNAALPPSFVGNADPPVIKGDPFILALKNSSQNISPY